VLVRKRVITFKTKWRGKSQLASFPAGNGKSEIEEELKREILILISGVFGQNETMLRALGLRHAR
jgi:hypothetical protein